MASVHSSVRCTQDGSIEESEQIRPAYGISVGADHWYCPLYPQKTINPPSSCLDGWRLEQWQQRTYRVREGCERFIWTLPALSKPLLLLWPNRGNTSIFLGARTHCSSCHKKSTSDRDGVIKRLISHCAMPYLTNPFTRDDLWFCVALLPGSVTISQQSLLLLLLLCYDQ